MLGCDDVYDSLYEYGINNELLWVIGILLDDLFLLCLKVVRLIENKLNFSFFVEYGVCDQRKFKYIYKGCIYMLCDENVIVGRKKNN